MRKGQGVQLCSDFQTSWTDSHSQFFLKSEGENAMASTTDLNFYYFLLSYSGSQDLAG